jgi:hypothetical protein
MSCFSLGFWEQVCILIVCIIFAYKIFGLLAPFLLQFLPDIVVQIIYWVIWLVVAIFCIHIIFDLLSCLLGAGGGLHFPSAGH